MLCCIGLNALIDILLNFKFHLSSQGGSRGRDEPPSRPFSAGIFGRSHNNTVYPQPNDTDVDVETGVNRNRRIRFSKAIPIPQRKLPDRGSNWNLVSQVVWLILPPSTLVSLAFLYFAHTDLFSSHISALHTDG